MTIFDLSEKVAIVTGGYGHLGKSITLALAHYGATVYVAGKSKKKFDLAFPQNHEKIKFIALNIASQEEFRAVVDSIVSDCGKCDILVNNAHFISNNSQLRLTTNDWEKTCNGVLSSVYNGITAVSEIMTTQKSGKIINIASMYGIVSPDFDAYSKADALNMINPPHYGALKAGVIQLTKYFATLFGKENVQVNSISPGPFPNVEVQNANHRFIEELKKRNVQNKIGQPNDLDGAILLFASSASNFITGQNLQVDGGWTIR